MTIIIVKDISMTAKTKDLMIDAAVRLLATRGLQATSFNEVLEITGTSRGSIYHHFPEGKDQMIAAAIDRAGQNTLALLNTRSGSSAKEITEYFLDLWRQLLVRSNFKAGCSVLAVTIATDSPLLLEHARNVFRSWRAALADLLEKGGLDHEAAVLFASQLVATSEGAVVIARAEKSMVTFEMMAAQLMRQLSDTTILHTSLPSSAS